MQRCLQCLNPINEAITIINFYKPPSVICEKCSELWQRISLKDEFKRCTRCLKALDKDEQNCEDCLFLKQHFNIDYQLICDYKYEGIMKDMIHQYKFLKDQYLSKVIAEMINVPKVDYDYIIPIPSPNERNIMRTFNPVVEVLKAKNVTYDNILSMKLRPKQANLNKRLRIKESNPFYVNEEVDLTNKVILLIDDIYTTGLTINHGMCKLSELNVRKFNVFAFAR